MFENLFSFDGRIRRTEYGISIIIYSIIIAIINVIIESNRDAAFLIIGYIPLLWFLTSQACKRCHDVGNSGWWQLIPLYALWLIFQEGNPGPNDYGNNPKGNQQNTPIYYPPITTQSQQQLANPNGGYGSGTYGGGHNNPNGNTNYSNNQNNRNNSSGEYNSGDLYK